MAASDHSNVIDMAVFRRKKMPLADKYHVGENSEYRTVADALLAMTGEFWRCVSEGKTDRKALLADLICSIPCRDSHDIWIKVHFSLFAADAGGWTVQHYRKILESMKTASLSGFTS